MKNIKIAKVRLGHATNSSSSHSVVILDKPASDDDVEYCEFGWNQFVASSSSAKLKYLATMIYQNLSGVLGYEMARLIASEWITPIPEDAYVDHQSNWALPQGKKRKGLNLEFIKDLKDFLLQNDVAIQGGNDNDGQPVPLGKIVDFPLTRYEASSCVARRDGDYWVLYNYLSGAKIRFSFALDAPEYTKASVPELVDLKITDYCEAKCPWCYQDAKPTGKHADADALRRIIYALGDMGVFEIALGGGDTMSYPRLWEVMDSARYAGITPNFTTHNFGWLGESGAERMLEMCGAWGFSTTNKHDIEKLRDILCKNDLPNKVTIHIIPDLCSRQGDLVELVRTAYYCDFPVLLLGFKKVGRGANYNCNTTDWLGVVQTLKNQGVYPRVSIDTALALQWQSEIAKAGYPRLLYSIEEGKFSCYIDAVNGMIGPSSYADDLYPLESRGNSYAVSIQERFVSF